MIDPRDWSPEALPPRVAALEGLTKKSVRNRRSPNLLLVRAGGRVVTATQDAEEADLALERYRDVALWTEVEERRAKEKGGPGWPVRLEVLEELARNMVGDAGDPNVYFVGIDGNIVLVTPDYESAYEAWRRYSDPMDTRTTLEDRQTGVIASVEEEEEDSDILVVRDDSGMFGFG